MSVSNVERKQIIRENLEAAKDNPERLARLLKSQEAAKPIMEELAKLGYTLDTLSELRHTGKSWKPALPVLLHWLPLIDDLAIKEEIVRCLSVPWVGNRATSLLIDEFKRYAIDKPLVAWTVGNALSIVDIDGFESDILDIVRNPAYGMARQMIVHELYRIQSPEPEQVLIDLLKDDTVSLHAIIALGKMKAKKALPFLEAFKGNKVAGIRKEARKAIAKITS